MLGHNYSQSLAKLLCCHSPSFYHCTSTHVLLHRRTWASFAKLLCCHLPSLSFHFYTCAAESEDSGRSCQAARLPLTFFYHCTSTHVLLHLKTGAGIARVPCCHSPSFIVALLHVCCRISRVGCSITANNNLRSNFVFSWHLLSQKSEDMSFQGTRGSGTKSERTKSQSVARGPLLSTQCGQSLAWPMCRDCQLPPRGLCFCSSTGTGRSGFCSGSKSLQLVRTG